MVRRECVEERQRMIYVWSHSLLKKRDRSSAMNEQWPMPLFNSMPYSIGGQWVKEKQSLNFSHHRDEGEEARRRTDIDHQFFQSKREMQWICRQLFLRAQTYLGHLIRSFERRTIMSAIHVEIVCWTGLWHKLHNSSKIHLTPRNARVGRLWKGEMKSVLIWRLTIFVTLTDDRFSSVVSLVLKDVVELLLRDRGHAGSRLEQDQTINGHHENARRVSFMQSNWPASCSFCVSLFVSSGFVLSKEICCWK